MHLSEGWEHVSYREFKGEDQPIAFASKSLTDVETRYANIERELLPSYLPARGSARIYSEGASSQRATTNPLEMIAMKNLANALPRL